MTLSDTLFGSISNSTIKIWDLQGICIRKIKCNVKDMALLPNDDIITLSMNGRIKICKKEWFTHINSRLILVKNKIITLCTHKLIVWK